MTCTAMCGNGVRIGREIILPALLAIPKVHLTVRAGSYAVAVGAMVRSLFDQPIATQAIFTAAMSIWAFVL